MRPEVMRLHSAALRYCQRNAAEWYAKYKRDDHVGGSYTTEDYQTFPRYQVLHAIRTELERLTGTDVGELSAARDRFASAGFTAQDEFTAHEDPVAKAAMREERRAFADFVRTISEAELSEVEFLPYARVLHVVEAERAWQSVQAVWGAASGESWYPLVETEREDVIAFDAHAFDGAIPSDALAGILSRHGIARVWELREYGPEYERDVSATTTFYNGAEGVWTSPALDWILYASHEDSITLGGWLVDEVKRAWPEWASHVWRPDA